VLSAAGTSFINSAGVEGKYGMIVGVTGAREEG